MSRNIEGWSANDYQCSYTNSDIVVDVLNRYAGLGAQRYRNLAWCDLVRLLDDRHVLFFVGDSQGSNTTNVMQAGASHWLVLRGITPTTVTVHDPGRTLAAQGANRAFTLASVQARYDARGREAVIVDLSASCGDAAPPTEQPSGQRVCHWENARRAEDQDAVGWFAAVADRPGSTVQIVSATLYGVRPDGSRVALAGTDAGQPAIDWAGSYLRTPWFGTDAHGDVTVTGAAPTLAVPTNAVLHGGSQHAAIGSYTEIFYAATVRTTGDARVQLGVDYRPTSTSMRVNEHAITGWFSCTTPAMSLARATPQGAGSTDCSPPGVSTCSAPMTRCGTACVNPSTDASNCGTCGHACSVGQTCSGGTCACASICPSPSSVACGAPLGSICGMACSGAGTLCPTGQVCSGGSCTCTMSCPSPNTVACGMPLGSACGTTCPGTGMSCPSGQTCSSGRCTCATACPDPSTVACGTPVSAPCGGGSCGTVGTMCPTGQLCTGGRCACSSMCPATSAVACGMPLGSVCGTTCPGTGTMCSGTQVCSGGTCTCPTRCPSPSAVACGSSLGSACGMSCPGTGTMCSGGQVCSSGTCVCPMSCPSPSTVACGSSLGSACGMSCPGTGTMCSGTQVCSGGTCTCPTRCPSPSAVACGSSLGSACGMSCPGTGTMCSGGQVCSSGTCSCPMSCPSASAVPCGDSLGSVCGVTCPGTGTMCSGGQVCTGGACSPVCGNGVCDAGESCSSCRADCSRTEVADYADNDCDGIVDNGVRRRLRRVFYSNGLACTNGTVDWDHCFSADASGFVCAGSGQGSLNQDDPGHDVYVYPPSLGSGTTVMVGPYLLSRLDSCYNSAVHEHRYAIPGSGAYPGGLSGWSCSPVGFVKTGSIIGDGVNVLIYEHLLGVGSDYFYSSNSTEGSGGACTFTHSGAWYAWTN